MRKIFNINGGIGRVIAFTGVIELLKKKEPETEIDIISNHPDVFWNNPNVNRVYPLNTPYLWDKIEDAYYFEPEPYNMYEYYHDHKHLINCFNILVNGEDIYTAPKLYLTDAEKEGAKQFIQSQPKPIVLVQPHGQAGGQAEDISYRSMSDEYAAKLCKAIEKAGYEPVIVKLPEQKGVLGYKTFQGLNGRQMAALLLYVKYAVGIDSFLQHAAVSLGVPMTVFWGATRREQLGYDLHNNILSVKPIRDVPNRIPHNIQNVEKLNYGVNQWSDKYIDEIVEVINGK